MVNANVVDTDAQVRADGSGAALQIQLVLFTRLIAMYIGYVATLANRTIDW